MEKINEWIASTVAWVIMMLIISPCLLLFTQGVNGEFTVWNVIGLAYSLTLLVIVVKKIKKRKDGGGE